MPANQRIDITFDAGALCIQYVDDTKTEIGGVYNMAKAVSANATVQIGIGVRNPVTNQKGQRYPFENMLEILIEFDGQEQSPAQFDIQQINNQPTWTPDVAGLAIALADIKGWMKAAIGGGAPIAPGGLATEATAISILNAIVAADQDIEILLVRDTVTLIVYQQITDYQTGVPVVTYKDVNGTPFVPVNPMEYLDPSAVLNLMLTELLNQGLTLDSIETTLITIDTVLDAIKLDTANLDVALSTRASEVTLLATNALLTTIDAVLDTIKTDTVSIAADTAAMVVDLAAIEVLITTTNSLITTIDGVLDTIKVDTGNIATDTSTLATPVTVLPVVMLRVNVAGAGSVTPGKRRVSFFNAGNTDAQAAGAVLKRGESVTFSADGLRDTLAGIIYDCLTSELLITTVG